jgi:hypothetical protein
MEVVVMDVHHINVLVRREDGTTATPKLDTSKNWIFGRNARERELARGNLSVPFRVGRGNLSD